MQLVRKLNIALTGSATSSLLACREMPSVQQMYQLLSVALTLNQTCASVIVAYRSYTVDSSTQ